jgi:hypothetical protein
MALLVNVEFAIFAVSTFVIIETAGLDLVTVKVWLKWILDVNVDLWRGFRQLKKLLKSLHFKSFFYVKSK